MKNHRTKAVLIFAIVAVAMLLAPVGTTQAGALETQSFDSEASAIAAGWTEFKSRDGVADYGWSNTNNAGAAGAAGGEAGGVIARNSPVSYYADITLGDALSGDDNLVATGSLYFDNTPGMNGDFRIGWFDRTKAEDNDKDYLGINIQEPDSSGDWRVRAIIDGDKSSQEMDLPDKTVLDFTITYNGTTKKNTVTFTDGIGGDWSSDVTSTKTLVLDAFGMMSNAQTGGEQGQLYIDDLAYTVIDPNLPSVDAGVDMISWTGQDVDVPMDPNIVEADGSHWTSLTYLWTAEPNGIDDLSLDVAITGADTEYASVTVTKTGGPTGDATVITMTLAVNNEGNSPEEAVTDTLTIDVYDTACLATRVGLDTVRPSDFDGNCDTDIGDFALMALDWLDDYAITAPIEKP